MYKMIYVGNEKNSFYTSYSSDKSTKNVKKNQGLWGDILHIKVEKFFPN